jgi:hypothetical protein
MTPEILDEYLTILRKHSVYQFSHPDVGNILLGPDTTNLTEPSDNIPGGWKTPQPLDKSLFELDKEPTI